MRNFPKQPDDRHKERRRLFDLAASLRDQLVATRNELASLEDFMRYCGDDLEELD